MVWEYLAGGLPVVGGIASSIMGANAQNASAAYNYAAAQRNAEAADRERFMQMLMADRQYRQQTAPTTNARGDRTEYIPGLGWITTPSDASRGLIEASDAEQRRRLVEDPARMRRGQEENERNRLQEGNQADAFLQQLQNPDTIDRSALRDILYSRAVAGGNEGFDRAQEQASTSAARRGLPTADIVSQIAGQRADMRAQAGMDSELQARSAVETLQNQDQQNNANLYNLFATRAANTDNVSFQPTNISNELSAGLGAQRGGASNAGLAAVSAAGRPGGRYQQIQPNFGNALAVGSSFDALGGMANQLYQQNQYQALIDMMSNRRLGNSSSTQSSRVR